MELRSQPQMLGIDAAELRRIDAWMAGYVENGRFPFACTVIARRGEVAYCAHVGNRDVEAGTAFEIDDIVRIYSMTKPVTSVALMMLVEEGLLSLDDPVEEFIPAFANRFVLREGASRLDEVVPARHKPTLHHLLTHCSGLTYDFNGGLLGETYAQREISFAPSSGGLEAAVERLCELPLLFEPGARWNYSVSTDVLGRVIEVVSGMPLDRFFSERIFAPLEMSDTFFAIPESEVRRFCSLYEFDGSGGMSLADASRAGTYRENRVDTFSGGGGLLSTAADYLKFAEMLRRGGKGGGFQIIAPDTLDLMTRNHLNGDLASSSGMDTWCETSLCGVGFGLGFAVMMDPQRAQMLGGIGDFGWGGMASTVFWVDPEKELTVVFLTQLSPSDSYANRKELRRLVYQALG